MTKTGTEVTIPDARINEALHEFRRIAVSRMNQVAALYPCSPGTIERTRNEMLDDMEAFQKSLASVDAPATGEQKLVPMEPTKKMLDAMEAAWCKHNHGNPYDKELPDIYRAMLAAAPADAPAPGEKPHD